VSAPGRLGVLISGRGSNLQALLDAGEGAEFPGRVVVVLSNVADAAGLDRARHAGVPAIVQDHRGRSREEHDLALVEHLRAHAVDLVCLAGYMRLLSPVLLRAYPGRVLNVHPSLLPSFPGLEAQRQAWDHGVKVTGATVHLVDEGLDTGPIIVQQAVAVLESDTPETLASRILEVEHRLYPDAVRRVLSGRLERVGRRLVEKENP
jgi:phosphoribosylglycinamide formyltransferase-1